MRHATLLDVLLHFHTVHTHMSCYAAGRSLALTHAHTHTSCYAAGRSLAFPRIRPATLLDVLPLLDSITV